MVIRIDRGVARYGLPGLLLGIGLAWVSGGRGPEVAAQTGSGRCRNGKPWFGAVRGSRPNSGTTADGRRRSEWDAGLDHHGRARLSGCISSTPRTARSLFTASIPRIPRGLSSSRPHASTGGTSSSNIITTRRRSPTPSRRR